MKISSISDLHIYEDMDERCNVLVDFLKAKETISSDTIILLGDIFDMMVGNKDGYLKKYANIFKVINENCQNKKLYYISGNHDFSLKNVLSKAFSNLDFTYSEKPIVLKDEDFNIYISHGDEVDTSDSAYKRWKSIYSHPSFQKFVDFALPYGLIQYLGKDASKKSKKRNVKKFDYEKAEKKYLKQLDYFKENTKADFYILGHTHIKVLTDKIANNGFPFKHRCFVFYSNKNLALVDL